jgi:hypothetical protein
MAFRIISFDCGNQYTGIAIIDIIDVNGDCRAIEVKYVDLHTDLENTMKTSLIQFTKDNIVPLIEDPTKCLCVYENAYPYPNRNLISIQKELRKYFENKQVTVRSLKPSQKTGIGGTKINRKDKSIKCAREILGNSGTGFLEKFESFSDRNHDIADAILSAVYVYEHPEIYKTSKTKTKKRKRS